MTDDGIEIMQYEIDLHNVIDEFIGDAQMKLNHHESDEKTGGIDVLENLSVDALTDEMIKEICALYAVDVLLMKHFNMKDEYCRGIVDTKYFI